MSKNERLNAMKRIFTLAAATLFAGLMCASARPAGAPQTNDGDAAPVRNLIYMIGDGMGLAHLTMLEIEGRFAPTSFDRAGNIALISTYSANNRVTDSAASGTALASGCKTNNQMLGMLPDSTAAISIMTKAEAEGYATGIVVTSSLLHATPGAFYAHVGKRSDEKNIAENLIECGFDVLIGGGRGVLSGESKSGKSFVDVLKANGYTVVDSLAAAGGVTEGRLAAICSDNHMPSMLEGRGDYLPQAVGKALEVLSANAGDEGKGLMLMVEGSQIDFESHSNNAEGILAEMRDFDRAIGVAMDFADRNPGTLVVVCADHETSGMAMPSNNKDFTESESGIKYVFGTGSHTASYIPVYLYGTGAELINGIMDNTELSRRLQEIFVGAGSR